MLSPSQSAVEPHPIDVSAFDSLGPPALETEQSMLLPTSPQVPCNLRKQSTMCISDWCTGSCMLCATSCETSVWSWIEADHFQGRSWQASCSTQENRPQAQVEMCVAPGWETCLQSPQLCKHHWSRSSTSISWGHGHNQSDAFCTFVWELWVSTGFRWP